MDTTPRRAPAALHEALDRSLADAAAGRTVDGQVVRQRLRDSIQRMEAALEREHQGEPSGLPRP